MNSDHTNTYYNQSVKSQSDYLESVKRKVTHHIQGSSVRLTISHEELWRAEASGLIYLECQPRILYPEKVFFTSEGEIKTLQIDYLCFCLSALDMPCRNAEGSPVGLNERTHDSNSKQYEDIKLAVEGNSWAILKSLLL